MKGKD
jgi:glutathione S-transferase